MSDNFWGKPSFFIPSWKMLGSFIVRFFIGFLFIRSTVSSEKGLIKIHEIVASAIEPYSFAIMHTAIIFIGAVVIFRIVEPCMGYKITIFRKKLFSAIFAPIGVFYSDVISSLMYLSGFSAGYAMDTMNPEMYGHSLQLAMFSFFLHNYIAANQKTLC